MKQSLAEVRMKANAYYVDGVDMIFPTATMRHIGHMVRNVKPIEGYRAIVDQDTDRTYAIVKSGYKLIQHQKVIDNLDELCAEFPDYGTPKKEVWLSNHGARMKTRYTFGDVDFEITPGDIVHPTLESFSSFDTSLAQRILMGGFRVVCTNGMVVGKILGEYKRKHTTSLNLDRARNVLHAGMKDYSDAVGLWSSFTERDALANEVTLYETLNFHKDEKLSVESAIKKQGKVITWDDDEPKNREVEINAWELYNILTAEATHRVPDITRRAKILDGVAYGFKEAA
ncbi:MAG: hypothetical protein DRQ46_04895 [Gammaproteobacteria bacterium]|nr:MAG: hypothetical protein DRQ46_04895 [Gammaproteobacteria bacterium]